jgi:hypothetical protein
MYYFKYNTLNMRRYTWYVECKNRNVIVIQIRNHNLFTCASKLRVACVTPSYSPHNGHGYNLDHYFRIFIRKFKKHYRDKKHWNDVHIHLYNKGILNEDVLRVISSYL